MSDSKRIIDLKNFLGISFNKLSEEIGLNNAQTLYDIKNGKHGISKDVAEKITSKYSNISFAWLLTGDGEMLVDSNGSSRKTPEVSPTVSELIATIGKQADIIKAQQETIRKLSETVRGLTMGAEDKSGLIG